ncbi:DNA-binding transcriptional activator of the SARP family [Amycolatopsis arida]|uniref:DNA-binding transcriptional activator of the SARP family n=1 Tax=Amycolatopsis arida TaxID=587909 RepID=A0A1I5V4B7_9PSEU|nr:BTAD domain-containing putative transcriptional regulator [Amycolatopsis arida]TDX91144.1 DNA-binding SARP family transcriptional activator [Amycolatopsis arida]SFQ02300.1 DNA-binding transcriptional activator of the SARP family [Amycolatopsis arida]
MAGLRFGVLGPITGWRGGDEVGFGAAKRSRVLAALLLHANRRVGREAIIDVVWGTDAPRSGVNLVQKYVGDLRRTLQQMESTGLLESTGTSYQLRLAPEQLDSWTFSRTVAQARAANAAGDLAAARRGLDAALRLWRGPAYDGIDAEPMVVERARLEESRMAAVEELMEIELQVGDHASVVAELSRLTREHPLRERLRELQMLGLYRAGRQAEALAVFADTRRLLADELGVDPGPGLRLMHERIVRADTALDVPTAPERHLDPVAVEPAAVAPPVYQLPRDVPDFTGRVIEHEALVGMLRDARCPPVVVAGAPGVGKSTLAVRAAHTVAAEFPGGQLYLNLAGTSGAPRDPAAMLAELLRALGVRGAAIPAGLDERAALYRSRVAGRAMLILLDDAADAAQVRPLLPGTAGCAVLITSRHRLADLSGARSLDLDVFGADEARQLLATVVGADRVAGEPEQADAIVRFCGFLPLAIRIAAGKLAGRPGWSLGVLRDRLADRSRRIGELRVGGASVRASFEVSVRMLADPARQAFRWLGLLGAQTFPGWVAGPLLDRPHADEVLDELLDANLLTAVGTDIAGQPRYRLHDLLRDYAMKAADGDPLDARRAAVGRVLGAWLHLAERAKEGLPPSVVGPPPGRAPRFPLGPDARRLLADPLAWFDAERVALLGAVELAVDWGLDELAWELASALVPYHDHRSLHDDWQHGHSLALRAVASAGNRRGEAALLRGLGQVQLYRDDYDRAVRALRRSRRLYREVGDPHGEAAALAGLATVHRLTGRYDDALASAGAALDLMAGVEGHPGEAQIRNGVGMVLLARGRLDEASPWFAEALRLAEASGDRHREATVLRNLSGLHERRGDVGTALRDLGRALTVFERLQDERCAAFTLLRVAEVRAAAGDGTRAVPAVERALAVFRRVGNLAEIAACARLLDRLRSGVAALPVGAQRGGAPGAVTGSPAPHAAVS